MINNNKEKHTRNTKKHRYVLAKLLHLLSKKPHPHKSSAAARTLASAANNVTTEAGSCNNMAVSDATVLLIRAPFGR